MSPKPEQYAEIDEVAAKIGVRVCSKVGLYDSTAGLVTLLRVGALDRQLFGGYRVSFGSFSKQGHNRRSQKLTY